jgi:peroxin-6
MRILTLAVTRFALHPALSLRSIVQRLPFTYTGADFYALCTDAMLKAVTRQANVVDARIEALNRDILILNKEKQLQQPLITTATFFDRFATPDDLAVLVTEADFVAAHQELVPSVSAGELLHYERVRAAFEGGSGHDRQSTRSGMRSPKSRDGFQGKGKGPALGPAMRKGKGSAVRNGDEDDAGDEDEDDEAQGNGRRRDKGKGKAVAAFHDSASDDDGLYES